MFPHFLTIFLSHDLRTRHKENNMGQPNMSLKIQSIQSIRLPYFMIAYFLAKLKIRAKSCLMGSISIAASSIKNPLIFHPGSTLEARLSKALIHLATSGFAELRVMTHATGSACCLESNTRSVHNGYCQPNR